MRGKVAILLTMTGLLASTPVAQGGMKRASGAEVDGAGGPQTIEVKAAEINSQLQTGTLLFSAGDCLAIRVFTASPYTHVAVVVKSDKTCTVYDSMNGVGVRKMPLSEYLADQTPDELHVFHPQEPLSEGESADLIRYLEGQLGRRYSIHHHLTGDRAEGVHCAEYATDALMAIERIHARQPARVSPASLLQGITQSKVYSSAGLVELRPAEHPAPRGRNRCEQLWLETCDCCSRTCAKLTGLFLCR